MNKLTAKRNLGLVHNVTINVIDEATQKIVFSHSGHNNATNGMLTGIGYYLTGQGVLNQGSALLSQFVPRYISLGTMGLKSQTSINFNGYKAPHIGVMDHSTQTYAQLSAEDLAYLGVSSSSSRITVQHQQMLDYRDYMKQVPGFGADGYDVNSNNGRAYMGIGRRYPDRPSSDAVNCELIADTFPRSTISFRDVVPEIEAEFAETIDVVFSAMISTGALAKFRGDNDCIYITEAGLWSMPNWLTDETGAYDYTGYNGLLAGYRIVPPDYKKWDMSKAENRDALNRSILRVGKNQVVQVVWKIQIGSIRQLTGREEISELQQ